MTTPKPIRGTCDVLLSHMPSFGEFHGTGIPEQVTGEEIVAQTDQEHLQCASESYAELHRIYACSMRTSANNYEKGLSGRMGKIAKHLCLLAGLLERLLFLILGRALASVERPCYKLHKLVEVRWHRGHDAITKLLLLSSRPRSNARQCILSLDPLCCQLRSRWSCTVTRSATEVSPDVAAQPQACRLKYCYEM